MNGFQGDHTSRQAHYLPLTRSLEDSVNAASATRLNEIPPDEQLQQLDGTIRPQMCQELNSAL